MTHRPIIGAALGSVVLAAGVVGTVHAEGDIIYDNGPVDLEVPIASQLDLPGGDYAFYAAAADDFIFSSSDFPGASTMTLTGFNWFGITWSVGGPAQITDIRIVIWPDAGGVPAGGQPCCLPPDESEALHIIEIPGNGNEMPTGEQNRFTYSQKLPTPVELEVDVVYWLQIQPVAEFFPQWGWAGSNNGPVIGNPAVQGFDFLGLAFWTPTSAGDISVSFQIQGFETVDFPCPWDLDNTNVVGTADLLDLLAQWGTDPGGPPDFNGDGNVGTSDLLDLLGHWGLCP